jgi:hypothetical protein
MGKNFGFYAVRGGLKNDVRRMSINTARKRKGGKTMKYSKPVIVAQNDAQGAFVAGCPSNTNSDCRGCERTN